MTKKTITKVCGKPAKMVVKGGGMKATPLCGVHYSTNQIKVLKDKGILRSTPIEKSQGATCQSEVEREI